MNDDQMDERPVPVAPNADPTAVRLAYLRARRMQPRPTYLTDRGRLVHGPTLPGGAVPWSRTSDLTRAEVEEAAALIAEGRIGRRSVVMPDRLRSRSWISVEQVLLALEDHLGWRGAGWKVGAASEEIRQAEKIPSPTPGRIYEHTVFASPAALAPELFVNYRVCECEFAFELRLDFPARDQPYTEAEAEAGIAAVLPVIEIGDSVFEDWYAMSSYLGGLHDNGGGAALVEGQRVAEWGSIDLPRACVDLYVNDFYVKSGVGAAAMGSPVTSLTWMLNWLRGRGRGVTAGEVVSTGTCTAHCFVARGDRVSADFGDLGLVEAVFE